MSQPNKVLFFCNRALESTNLAVESRFVFIVYKVEALCMVGKYTEAVNLLQEHSPKSLGGEQNLTCINGRVRDKSYSEISLNSKVVYYLNLAIAIIFEGNKQEIPKNIQLALQSLDPSMTNNLPTSLLQTLIYLNRRNGNTDVAYQYLRHRRISNNSMTKPLLNISK